MSDSKPESPKSLSGKGSRVGASTHLISMVIMNYRHSTRANFCASKFIGHYKLPDTVRV